MNRPSVRASTYRHSVTHLKRSFLLIASDLWIGSIAIDLPEFNDLGRSVIPIFLSFALPIFYR